MLQLLVVEKKGLSASIFGINCRRTSVTQGSRAIHWRLSSTVIRNLTVTTLNQQPVNPKLRSLSTFFFRFRFNPNQCQCSVTRAIASFKLPVQSPLVKRTYHTSRKRKEERQYCNRIRWTLDALNCGSSF